MGRDLSAGFVFVRFWMFQSTRPRGARHNNNYDNDSKRNVSIHAPTWGATGAALDFSLDALKVSIHAPTWGATGASASGCRWLLGFNPRAHVGRDSTRPSPSAASTSFNPRAHVGRDFDKTFSISSEHEFQSTRPRGARLAGSTSEVTHLRFNPRAHVGRDLGYSLQTELSAKFQSTRPRGARPASGGHKNK